MKTALPHRRRGRTQKKRVVPSGRLSVDAENVVTSRQRRRLEKALRKKIDDLNRALGSIHLLSRDIYDVGIELFQCERSLVSWLVRPSRALGGKIPLDVARTSEGRTDVMHIMRAIDCGIYL